ncbi:hypothetical protein I6A60_34090 [Frankia sp. AgB1.9]|nr:hypothetical protein [Frankia sp. AgW1.1]MBL7552848.1 hypothetical protein [Frankia sp. AgB1.9]MBL7620139.1 hypothetical protein [Frankia sp. AgB1.8]
MCVRFATDGEAALIDRPRPGRPRRYGPDVRLAVLAPVTETAPQAVSRWSHRDPGPGPATRPRRPHLARPGRRPGHHR